MNLDQFHNLKTIPHKQTLPKTDLLRSMENILGGRTKSSPMTSPKNYMKLGLNRNLASVQEHYQDKTIIKLLPSTSGSNLARRFGQKNGKNFGINLNRSRMKDKFSHTQTQKCKRKSLTKAMKIGSMEITDRVQQPLQNMKQVQSQGNIQGNSRNRLLYGGSDRLEPIGSSADLLPKLN